MKGVHVRKHPSPNPARPEETSTRKSLELKTTSRAAVSLRNARKSPSNIYEGGASSSIGNPSSLESR